MSCNNNKNQGISDCKDLEIKDRHINQMGRGYGSVMFTSYAHTLILKKYDEKCFDQYDFISFADKYLDTVTTYRPVSIITFCRPFNFEPYGDSRDLGPIRKYSIVGISYTEDSVIKKVPEINSIVFWRDGKYYSLDYLPVRMRQQTMDYYHEKQRKK